MLTTILDGIMVASEVSEANSAVGQTVVLLHGWGGSHLSMQSVATGLVRQGFRVHNLDLPGFGASPLPPVAWGAADYARVVADYITQHQLGRVHLIGHSFGGRISLVLGADYPQLINKIVLTAAAGVKAAPTARDQAIQIGKALFKLPGLNALEKQAQAFARQAVGSEDLKQAGPLEPTFRKLVAEDLVPYAQRIAASTLLIWGDADVDTPLWQAQVLEKAINDAGLVVFKGATHFAYQERLTDFLRIVGVFLAERGA